MIKTFFFDDINEISSNTYIIGEKNGPCVVIDVGSNSDKIINYIKENHSFVAGILLTHGHYDHIKGLKHLLSKFKATIFISEKEKDFLTNPNLNLSIYHNEIIKLDLSNLYLLDDMDEIKFPNEYIFKVIETPYHTEGSVCYLLEKENAIFTGDSLFKLSVGRSDLPTGNYKEMNNSLKKIKNLNKKLNIYPGHGELTNLEFELKNNLYLK